MIYAPSEDSAWASVQFDQSLLCAQGKDFFMQTVKTDQTGQVHALIGIFAGRTSFCRAAAQSSCYANNK